ncbi:MAG: collagen-like protein [Prevotella sp.]|nr:collagen-like protein [Alistipes senegalensis]MCM1357025.1 collagen-like protein [Prevotella sp.]MCM1472604.1 collagen-like protein [Muribaculaceae bacterium]
MWKFLVKQQKIEILEREVIADQQISFVSLKFIFDGDWKKFHKVVQFTQCDETYNRVLGTDGISCLLPSELHSGAVRMSVFGYDSENINGLRATTVPVTLNVRPSGFVSDGAEEIPPTPDLYTQLLQKLEEKASSLQNGVDGKDGENGFSPTITTEMSVNGYTFTVTDINHTETITVTNGKNGADGNNGVNGLSAYEIAKNNGFEGTLTQWLTSLKGDKGDTGKQGVKGDKGEKGDTGEQGIQGEKGSTGATGKTGASGKSAYEIWLSAGNSGTETDFLNSLKGEKGDTGKQGIQGDKGDKGATGAKGSKGDTGADGKSAYDVWISQGNSGTEADFLNSLKGEKGDKGDTGSASVDTEKIEEKLAELTNKDTLWGNFNPVGRAEFPNACLTYYVPTGQKRTFAVIPRIADIENNALNNSPAGMFVLDLTERVENLENSSHAHNNKEFLDRIETTLNSRISVLSASLTAVDEEQWRHINGLEEVSHTHENMDYLDSLIPTISSMSAKLFAIEDEHGKKIETLTETSHTHENMDYLDNLIPTISSMSSRILAIESEHGKRIERLETSLEDVKTILADVVEVTE